MQGGGNAWARWGGGMRVDGSGREAAREGMCAGVGCVGGLVYKCKGVEMRWQGGMGVCGRMGRGRVYGYG